MIPLLRNITEVELIYSLTKNLTIGNKFTTHTIFCFILLFYGHQYKKRSQYRKKDMGESVKISPA